jgi:hypothetical protein
MKSEELGDLSQDRHELRIFFNTAMSLSFMHDFTLPPQSTGYLRSSVYYAAYSGNSLPTFRDIVLVQYFRIKKSEGWTDRLS